MTKDLTKGKIIFLIVYAIVLTLLCKRVISRLRARADDRAKALELAANDKLASET